MSINCFQIAEGYLYRLPFPIFLAENSLLRQEIDSQSSPVVRIAQVSHVPSKPEHFLSTLDQLQVHVTFSSMSSYPSLACSTSGSVKMHVALLLHFNLIWKFLIQRISQHICPAKPPPMCVSTSPNPRSRTNLDHALLYHHRPLPLPISVFSLRLALLITLKTTLPLTSSLVISLLEKASAFSPSVPLISKPLIRF
jgi:hypothetical protein